MRRAMWGKLLATFSVILLLVAGIAIAIHATTRTTVAPSRARDRVENLSAIYVLINDTDVIQVNLTAATIGASVVYTFSAPNSTDSPAVTRNTTEGELVTVNLSALPRLFVIHAYVYETNAPVYAKWAWIGRANVLIADTPGQLAQRMKEASS